MFRAKTCPLPYRFVRAGRGWNIRCVRKADTRCGLRDLRLMLTRITSFLLILKLTLDRLVELLPLSTTQSQAAASYPKLVLQVIAIYNDRYQGLYVTLFVVLSGLMASELPLPPGVLGQGHWSKMMNMSRTIKKPAYMITLRCCETYPCAANDRSTTERTTRQRSIELAYDGVSLNSYKFEALCLYQ